jgi:HPt (histidine-containing phosphotransfer) domain-containing protein
MKFIDFSKEKIMSPVEPILEEKVLRSLVQDIGLENTRKFMESLDNEFQKRIQNIKQAMSDHSLAALSAQAHSLKSSAQVSGAYRLAEALAKLEVVAGQNQDEAFAMAQDVLTLAELTRFAYLDVKLDK